MLAEVYQEIDASGIRALDAKIEDAVAEVSKGRRAEQMFPALTSVEELYGTIKGLDRATLVHIAEDEELCGY